MHLQLVLVVEEVSSSKVKVPSLLRMYLWKMSRLGLHAIYKRLQLCYQRHGAKQRA